MEVCQSLHLSCSIIHGFIACQEKPQNEIVWCSDAQLALPLSSIPCSMNFGKPMSFVEGRLGPKHRWVIDNNDMTFQTLLSFWFDINLAQGAIY